MLCKKGDVVHIHSEDWFKARETINGEIFIPKGYSQIFNRNMYEYCGKTATIIEVDEEYKLYKLDIDSNDMRWNWEDWMFDFYFNSSFLDKIIKCREFTEKFKVQVSLLQEILEKIINDIEKEEIS
jgi:hypothetical protein